MALNFEWDMGNLKHIIDDHLKRENTVEEVESVFNDENFISAPDKIDEHGEQRYSGVGVGNDKDEKFVIFVVRNGSIRPISCRRANKKDRIKYYENIIKKIGIVQLTVSGFN